MIKRLASYVREYRKDAILSPIFITLEVLLDIFIPLYMGRLIDYGIDLPYLNKRHFRTKSWKRMQLEAAILGGMELHDEGAVAIACITLDMMSSIGATQNDTEDIANLVGALEGGKNKISLRTDPNWLNASATCALLGGGGHAAASGATVDADVEETKRVILDAIHQVKHGN